MIAVTHDLNLAATYCDRLVLLAEGKVVADDHPREVLRPQLIREVFKVEAEIRQTALGRPSLTFSPLHGRVEMQ